MTRFALASTLLLAASGVALAASNSERFEGWFNGANQWGGTITENNSAYAEGDTIPLRYSASLAAGSTHTLLLRWDFSSGGPQRFFDSITSLTNTVTNVNPAVGISGAGSPTAWTIPADATLPAGAQLPGKLTTHNVAALSFGNYTNIGGVRMIPVSFTVISGGGKKNVILACGGHLAREFEWGVGNGAARFPGASTKAFASLDSASDMNVSVNPTAVIRDFFPPVITCPASIVRGNDAGQCGAVVNFTVTATDDRGPATVVCSPPSGSLFPEGVTTVNCTATDAAGNTSSCSFTVTVEDREKPQLICPSPIVAGTDPGKCDAVVSFAAPIVLDNCPGVTVVSVPPSGSTFPKGVTPVVCTATDAAGNQNSCSFTVTVNDTEAPQITCASNIVVTADAGKCSSLVSFALPTATDNCPGVTVTSSVPSGADFPLGTTPVTFTATDAAGLKTSCTINVTVQDAGNGSWPAAQLLTLTNAMPGVPIVTGEASQCITQLGQSRWYRFKIVPGSKVIVLLTGLPENYDLVLFKDIGRAFNDITGTTSLVQLNAQFAPEAFSPAAFSPEAFSPEAFSPAAFSPAAFSPAAFSPAAFSPEAFSPEAFSPEAFSPEAFSPEAFSPAAFSPEAFSPAAFSPAAFSPAAFSPAAFSAAQMQSVLAVSAFPGLAGEGILANTWNNDGEFYLRVRGRNGAFSTAAPFKLQVLMLTGLCDGVNPVTTPSGTTATAGGFKSIILLDSARMPGLDLAKVNSLAARAEVAGVVVDVGTDAKVASANAQADTHPDCPYAKNLVAAAIKELIEKYRALNPLQHIVIVGNDNVIPFYRHPDQALLASEKNYVPPVKDSTSSQAALRLGYVLGQDYYGAHCLLSAKVDSLPVPDLAVGRLVESPADVTGMIDAYLGTVGGVVTTPTKSLVTGYDFLADVANAVKADLNLSLGTVPDSLISPNNAPPELGWTADQLRVQLLGSRHDLIFLAGHFSANAALAADYQTRVSAPELVASSVNLLNAIIYSSGCHSAYNIVDPHGINLVTVEPDWAQAFAHKGATFIGGTGYQYGDTDFIEYSERLYLEFTRQLRAGTGPVSVGQALVAAKKLYLANTAQMRGIHEKSLLQTTLFGLPMLRVNLPGGRGAIPSDASVIASTTPYASNPGVTLGLSRSDLTVTPALTANLFAMTNVEDGSAVTAKFYSGFSGVLANPAEPVLPLEARNVTVAGQVLRGVGFLGGSYADEADVLPLTGAPTTEIRGVHAPFLSEVFFPVRPWQVNYFDAVCEDGGGAAGATRLFSIPAQFKSGAPGSRTGTLRKFNAMNFRLYYSANTQTYVGSNGVPSTPSTAAAPDIVNVSDTVNSDSVEFRIRVTGNPAAGVQEVWITHTAESGPMAGQWQSLFLVQDAADSTLWRGTLALGGTAPADVRYLVQAANGVGLVSLDTHFGGYYVPGEDPDPNAAATSIEFSVPPPTQGAYNTKATFSARLTSGGAPVANKLVTFAVGSQRRSKYTDTDGLATATVQLIVLPDQYELKAYYAGSRTLLPSHVSSPFEVTKKATGLALAPASVLTKSASDTKMVTTLTDADGRPLGEKTVFFIVSGPNGTFATPVITDFAGRAPLGAVPLPDGSYTVNNYFSGPIPLPGETLTLNDERYIPSFASGGLLILDLTLPTITCPSNIVRPTDPGQCSAVVNYTVTADDNRPDVTIVCTPPSGSVFPKGVTLVSCVATDAAGNTASCNFTVTINDTQPPVLNCPSNIVVSTDTGKSNAVVNFSVTATDNCPGLIVTTSKASGSTFPIGTTTVTSTATDAAGNQVSCSFTVTVRDTEPPLIKTLTASPNKLRPPNHRMELITVTATITDNAGPTTCKIISVTSNEPINGTGDGDQEPDWQIVGDGSTMQTYVRAERAQNGTGRIYTITVQCTDSVGNVATKTTTVLVPK